MDHGRSLMEYSFEVSQEESRYQVKVKDLWVHSAYSGTFQADRETDEVVRVTLQTAELPAEMGSCLPPWLPFTLELTEPISTNTAAAGDSFAGRLVSALRDKSGKTLALAHALVEGRLVLVEMRHAVPPGAVLVLKPTAVEIGGVKTPLGGPEGRIDAKGKRADSIASLMGTELGHISTVWGTCGDQGGFPVGLAVQIESVGKIYNREVPK
jgi:hypothetical protein